MVRKICTIYNIQLNLEYAATVCSLHLRNHIKLLERIQRTATRMVFELNGQNHEVSREPLDHPTLEERRIKGDVITYEFLGGHSVFFEV